MPPLDGMPSESGLAKVPKLCADAGLGIAGHQVKVMQRPPLASFDNVPDAQKLPGQPDIIPARLIVGTIEGEGMGDFHAERLAITCSLYTRMPSTGH